MKWTIEILKSEALKYNTNKEFRAKSPNAYAAACRKKLIKEICPHMEPIGHRFKRLVYVYEFSDNHAYVGLTYNKDKRHYEHIRDGRGPVFKHIQKTKSNPSYVMVSDWYIPKSEAQKLEIETYNKYLNDGWTMLNSAPCGNLGGNDFKYSDEYLGNIVKQFGNRKELKLKNPNVYSLIITRKLYHLFNHMVWNGNTTYNLEEVIEICKNYKTRNELRKNNYGVYQWVYTHKYEDVCFSHMKKMRKIKWDTNEALEISKKYVYLEDFVKNDFRAYRHLIKSKHKELPHLIRITPDTEEFRNRISRSKQLPPITERTCKICNVTKPFSNFYGKRWRCKSCYNKK